MSWMKSYDNKHAECEKAAVIRGEKYRISILTPSLIRLEYNENGYFEDRATQAVINRKFPVPEFSVHETADKLVVETEDLLLSYDRAPFSAEGLSVTVKALENAVWHYGQELQDLKGTYRTLDHYNGNLFELDNKPLQLGHGVLSREGFSVIDDSRSMALTDSGWVEPRKETDDLYFFGYGHRYLECLNDFYRLCGSTPLLPRFALGNWWSRCERYTEKSYKELMNRFEEEKLPFTVAVLDMFWHLVDDVDHKYGEGYAAGWTGYTWNKKFFPEPEKFMEWLHQKGLKVTLNLHPASGIRPFEEIYPKAAAAMGIDPESEETVEFDVSSPEFLDVYFNVVCRELEKQGCDFWWIDWQHGTESKIPGLDPLWVLNHYHYQDSSRDGKRPMIFSRYAEVGSHRYPIGFSGDTHITWDSLNYQPYFTNTASNIGYGWWSHDIGGFKFGARDEDLMVRWVQYGVFSPIMRLHSGLNPFLSKEPWKFDLATQQVMNRFLRLRHAMIPYLYTMNRRAHQENKPLIFPMYYLEPEREEAYQVPNEYYFGTELLVSPITQPSDRTAKAGKAKTWLPEGVWADFFTGMICRGGKMMDLWRSAEHIPVLMKAGAIVPMRDLRECDNSVANPAAMELRIFPAADGSFTLWEDDGDSVQDSEENWAFTEMVLNTGKRGCFSIRGAQGNLSVLPGKRSWKLVFVSAKRCRPDVYAEGRPIDTEISYDEESNSLILEVPETEITKEIRVDFRGELALEEKTPEDRWFQILLRSQMCNTLKKQIYDAITNDPENAEAYLQNTEMDEGVKSCLLEVIFSKKAN